MRVGPLLLRRLMVGCLATTLCQQSIAAIAADTQAQRSRLLPEEANFLFGEEPTAPSAPTPRTPDGTLIEWILEGLTETRPVGNIGKDLPGFQLP